MHPAPQTSIFPKHVSAHTPALLLVFHWLPFASQVNCQPPDHTSSKSVTVCCPPPPPALFLISFFHLSSCLNFLPTWHWSGSLPFQPSPKPAPPPSVPMQTWLPVFTVQNSSSPSMSSSNPLLPRSLLWFSLPNCGKPLLPALSSCSSLMFALWKHWVSFCLILGLIYNCLPHLLTEISKHVLSRAGEGVMPASPTACGAQPHPKWLLWKCLWTRTFVCIPKMFVILKKLTGCFLNGVHSTNRSVYL